MENRSNIQINKGGLSIQNIENLNIDHEAKGKKVNMLSTANQKNAASEKVFIIHGHNEGKWRELQLLLKNINVEAIELSMITLNGKTIIEKFENIASQCRFAIAIFTYDDIINGEYLQVRPNVIFELGWFFAKLGRENTMILEEIKNNGKIFSDLDGIYRYRFHENINELYEDIVKVLTAANIIQ